MGFSLKISGEAMLLQYFLFHLELGLFQNFQLIDGLDSLINGKAICKWIDFFLVNWFSYFGKQKSLYEEAFCISGNFPVIPLGFEPRTTTLKV